MKSPKQSSKKLSPGGGQKLVQLRLSEAAEADLGAIDEYSNDMFGSDVTDSYMRGFSELFDLLRHHPRAGPLKPELGRDIRCAVHRKHRIFYRIEGQAVLIVRIIHHTRNAKRELGA